MSRMNLVAAVEAREKEVIAALQGFKHGFADSNGKGSESERVITEKFSFLTFRLTFYVVRET
jgi:hypothetical protein